MLKLAPRVTRMLAAPRAEFKRDPLLLSIDSPLGHSPRAGSLGRRQPLPALHLGLCVFGQGRGARRAEIGSKQD